MSKRETLIRYSLIIKKLRRVDTSFKEISEYLKRESELQEYNFNVSLRTFQRDLNDIREIFKIDIQYDRSRNVYFTDKDEEPEMNERILEAFDTFNALNVSDRLSKYIQFEKRKPQGTENLHGLLHAIQNKRVIHFSYQKFWEDTEHATQRTTEPYLLKEFKNRWYIMAKDHKDDGIKSFALDRLSNLEITKQKFAYPKDFDIEEWYRYCFGIVSADGLKPQKIVLQFNAHQGKYIKSLPLHHTQKTLLDNNKELQIELKLCLTFDFLMELLSYGDNVKVLEPKALINQVKQAHEKAFKQY